MIMYGLSCFANVVSKPARTILFRQYQLYFDLGSTWLPSVDCGEPITSSGLLHIRYLWIVLVFH